MIVKLPTEHHLECLGLKGGCRGSSETTLVKMSHCWKSHVMAQIEYSLVLKKSVGTIGRVTLRRHLWYRGDTGVYVTIRHDKYSSVDVRISLSFRQCTQCRTGSVRYLCLYILLRLYIDG